MGLFNIFKIPPSKNARQPPKNKTKAKARKPAPRTAASNINQKARESSKPNPKPKPTARTLAPMARATTSTLATRKPGARPASRTLEQKKHGRRIKSELVTKSTPSGIPAHEFRRNKTPEAGGHPAYIYEKVGRKRKYLGLTKAKQTDGVDNLPLKKNPEPGNLNKSYVRPNARIIDKTAFGDKYENWDFAPEDKSQISKLKK